LQDSAVNAGSALGRLEVLLFDASPLMEQQELHVRLRVTNAKIHQPAQVFPVARDPEQTVQMFHSDGVRRFRRHQTPQNGLSVLQSAQSLLKQGRYLQLQLTN